MHIRIKAHPRLTEVDNHFEQLVFKGICSDRQWSIQIDLWSHSMHIEAHRQWNH